MEAESDRTMCNFVERLSAHACDFLEADKYNLVYGWPPTFHPLVIVLLHCVRTWRIV